MSLLLSYESEDVKNGWLKLHPGSSALDPTVRVITLNDYVIDSVNNTNGVIQAHLKNPVIAKELFQDVFKGHQYLIQIGSRQDAAGNYAMRIIPFMSIDSGILQIWSITGTSDYSYPDLGMDAPVAIFLSLEFGYSSMETVVAIFEDGRMLLHDSWGIVPAPSGSVNSATPRKQARRKTTN